MKLENYKSDLPCLACNESRDGYICFHHLTTRGSGGNDHAWNLMPLCFKHHTEIHKIGLLKFISKYPDSKIDSWLINHKWEFVTFINKWIRPIES